MGHWYAKDGTPEHFRGPNGSPTTLREARKLGLVPSVTEILQVIAKPALETWRRNQAVLAALTLQRDEDEPDSAYLARINADAAKQAQEAAAEGTAIHDAIEASFSCTPFPARFTPHVDAVRARLIELFPKVHDWVPEKSFASPLGFGGKCDLHSPSAGIVIDWKGRDGDFSDGKRLAWEQHYQLAAYQRGLGLPRAVGINVFVSRTHPGCIATHIWEEADMEQGWAVFEAALRLHKAIRKFDGGWK